MPSSSQRSYSRFIPSEEVGLVTQWKFGAVDGSEPVEPEPEVLPEPEPLPPDPAEVEAAQLALVQQACDAAFSQGLAQGQADTALEWQQRMDDYVSGQALEMSQSIANVVQSLQESLAAMQQRMAQDVLALACDIAREVVRRELSVSPDVLEPVVREAVGMLVAEGRPAMVRLNPADMGAVEQPLRDEMGAGIQWVADAAVPAGGCLVESGGTVVDGSVDKRWERAIASLGLESPWQERGDER